MEKRDVIYSENGKVSLRQTYRMLFLEIFGISSLILPAPLAKICQNDGIFAILAAGVLWYFILRLGIFAQKRADYFSGADAVDSGTDSMNRSEVLPDAQRIAEESNNSCGKNIKGTLQGVIFAIAGGFLFYILTSLVENQLLDTGYLWIVVLTLLFAGGYGIIRGIECRARIYEILFWILVIPLVIVFVLAAGIFLWLEAVHFRRHAVNGGIFPSGGQLFLFSKLCKTGRAARCGNICTR